MRWIDIRKTAFWAESWNVAWRRGNPGKIISDMETPFNIIENSFRYWAADPFVYERDGNVYIFAELYDYILCRGVLGYCKLSNSSKAKWTPVIVEETHLSYPCIIEYQNKIYLMPETSESKELVLYEAIEFPKKWEKKHILRNDITFADATPISWEKKALALTHDVVDAYNPKLLLIDLENPNNDVYIEQASAFQSRPAGNVFQYGTECVRPAQFSLNCDEGYGKGLLFYSCTLNSEMKYDEQLIKKVMPENLKYSRRIQLDGLHTYNASEHYEVIDIKTRRFNVLNFGFRVLNKFIRR